MLRRQRRGIGGFAASLVIGANTRVIGKCTKAVFSPSTRSATPEPSPRALVLWQVKGMLRAVRGTKEALAKPPQSCAWRLALRGFCKQKVLLHSRTRPFSGLVPGSAPEHRRFLKHSARSRSANGGFRCTVPFDAVQTISLNICSAAITISPKARWAETLIAPRTRT